MFLQGLGENVVDAQRVIDWFYFIVGTRTPPQSEIDYFVSLGKTMSYNDTYQQFLNKYQPGTILPEPTIDETTVRQWFADVVKRAPTSQETQYWISTSVNVREKATLFSLFVKDMEGERESQSLTPYYTETATGQVYVATETLQRPNLTYEQVSQWFQDILLRPPSTGEVDPWVQRSINERPDVLKQEFIVLADKERVAGGMVTYQYAQATGSDYPITTKPSADFPLVRQWYEVIMKISAPKTSSVQYWIDYSVGRTVDETRSAFIKQANDYRILQGMNTWEEEQKTGSPWNVPAQVSENVNWTEVKQWIIDIMKIDNPGPDMYKRWVELSRSLPYEEVKKQFIVYADQYRANNGMTSWAVEQATGEIFVDTKDFEGGDPIFLRKDGTQYTPTPVVTPWIPVALAILAMLG